jgi:acyl-CoA thioesterase-2
MSDSQRLLAALELEPADGGADRYLAMPQSVPWEKAYGGDMVAQALRATQLTVGDDRSAHSLHGYFTGPVSQLEAVDYQVTRVRDGRAFSTRSVAATQAGRTVYIANVSFHVPESGTAPYDSPPPAEPTPVEQVPSSADALAGLDTEADRYWAEGRSFDIRHVDGDVYHEVDGRTPSQRIWIRSFEKLPDDPALHQAALAYACDYTILEPALRVLGVPWSAAGLQTASLDHSMWFHADVRADQWLLYVQDLRAIAGNRAFVAGRFFTPEGVAVASLAQEGLIRAPR